MTENSKDIISDDAEPTAAEVAKGLRLISSASLRKQMIENEITLKGYFVDWVFNSLNLKKYR